MLIGEKDLALLLVTAGFPENETLHLVTMAC